MKEFISVICILLASFSLIWLMISCSMADRAPRKTVGLISAIDPDQHKMNIKLLQGRKNHTMTGTLKSNTVFIENGHPAALSDFKEEDVVLVQWDAARNDKSIEFVRKGAEVARFIDNQ